MLLHRPGANTLLASLEGIRRLRTKAMGQGSPGNMIEAIGREGLARRRLSAPNPSMMVFLILPLDVSFLTAVAVKTIKPILTNIYCWLLLQF